MKVKASLMNDPFPLRLGAVVKPAAVVEPPKSDAVKWVDGPAMSSGVAAMSPTIYRFSPGAISGNMTEIGIAPWKVWKSPDPEDEDEPAEDAFVTIEQRCNVITAQGGPYARTETGAPDVPAAIRGGGVLGAVAGRSASIRGLLDPKLRVAGVFEWCDCDACNEKRNASANPHR